MSSRKKQQPDSEFRVGSQVYFLFGRSRLKGVITEDRGAIGYGGRRLYRVEAPMGPDETPIIGEFPAESLQPAQPLGGPLADELPAASAANTRKSPKASRAEQQFRVGSRVAFRFGQERMVGSITEDRGATGYGGRRLFRVEAPFGPDEPPLITELSADDLQPA